MRLIILLNLLCGLSLAAYAQSNSQSMDGMKWKDSIRESLKDELCAPNSYALSCYEMTAKDCRTAITKGFSLCERAVRIPHRVDPLTDGVRLAYNLGSCTGRRVDHQYRYRKKDNPDCNRPEKWTD